MIDKSANISQIAVKLLGTAGKLIPGSKSLGPATAIWNAQIVDATRAVVWFGDIDIERHRDQLIELSKQLGLLHILREFGESLDDALVMIDPDRDKIWIDDKYAQYIRTKTIRQRHEK